ncbi:MAG: DmsC/YnfH family molybdoenzyme membrane anchor subunit [Alphaproteobacteria bacterium]
MNPAYSVIFFTTFSGLGYGLLVWLGVAAATGVIGAERGFGFTAFALAFGAVTTGLLASTYHLGHPERAWRALSQWRSSWLSREGVLAIATYVPTGMFAAAWVLAGRNHGVWAAIGVIGAVLAFGTIITTGMIYASLATIRQWRHGLVVPNYLALGLMTGGIWIAALASLFGIYRASLLLIAIVMIVLAWGLKLAYWFSIDRGSSASTPETATGLGGAEGKVRLLESPHTQENYVMAEMGYKIARKHARKLRRWVQVLAFALPLALILATGFMVVPSWSALPMLTAAILATAGVFLERWLFFAEARHVVTLFYGAERV